MIILSYMRWPESLAFVQEQFHCFLPRLNFWYAECDAADASFLFFNSQKEWELPDSIPCIFGDFVVNELICWGREGVHFPWLHGSHKMEMDSARQSWQSLCSCHSRVLLWWKMFIWDTLQQVNVVCKLMWHGPKLTWTMATNLLMDNASEATYSTFENDIVPR